MNPENFHIFPARFAFFKTREDHEEDKEDGTGFNGTIALHGNDHILRLENYLTLEHTELVELFVLGDNNNGKTYHLIDDENNSDIDTIGKLIKHLEGIVAELSNVGEECSYDPTIYFKYVRLQLPPYNKSKSVELWIVDENF